MNQKKILIAEDDKKAFEILKRVLTKSNWIVESAPNGEEALKILKGSSFDVLITDLNMPKMNGMELISRIRTEIHPKPKIIMTTAYGFTDVQKRAMDLGVSAFFSKPLNYKELSKALFECYEASKNDSHTSVQKNLDTPKKPPPFIGVGIAISTGGPQTLKQIFNKWTIPSEAVFLIVQHGPEWCLSSIAERFNKDLEVKAELAKDGVLPKNGTVYIAPGNFHLCIDPATYKLRLVDSPPEHFLRPAADPFFRSAAESFGPHFLAVILTGLGRDGTQGAQLVADMNGKVLIQDPETAIAPFMAKAAIQSGVKHRIATLAGMRLAIEDEVSKLSKSLLMA
jgi:two-component system, chemotaxis family, protein-glutamate methylesterase/glutaminase